MTIAEKRKELGYTRGEFAKALSVAQSTVSRWERGITKVDERTWLAVNSLRKKRRK